MNRRVYLDHNASTPVHPEVVEAMLPYFAERFGNPSSVHAFGREAREGLETAREQIAHFLRVGKEEIVFTSGGTESDNMAVKGVAMARGKGHIITSQIEHHAVLRTCESLERLGFEVTYLPVDGHGMVDPDEVRRHLRPDTILVSVMHANSEVGTIEPVREIGRVARERKVPFHVDAVQTFGKVPIDLDGASIDLLSFSSHKIYGPKGVAGLFIRRGTKMVSVQHGGEHERRRRAGTENVAGIVGFGKAVEVRARDMADEAARATALRNRLWEGISARVPEVRLNGHPTERLPGNLNVSFAYVEGESLLMGISDVAVSSGSACTSATLEPSYVIRALGTNEELAHSSIRFGVGRFNTEEEVDFVTERVSREVKRLREMSPLYEMAREGIDLKSVNWRA